MDLVAATKDWVQAPFVEKMDVWHVFLLTGLVVVSALLWSRVLARLGE